MKWSIERNVIVKLQENGKVVAPDASEIFSEVTKEANADDKSYQSITEALPDIRFSRISQEVRMRLEMISGKITIRLYILRRGKEIEVVPFNGKWVTHIIIDNTWVFFSENYNKIIELLGRAGSGTDRILSFSAYVRLLDIKHEYSYLIIEDNVREALVNNNEINQIAVIPKTLNARLYPYQETGFKWLKYITDENCGCILGDEMGLGKTLLAITLLLERRGK